MPPDLTLWAQTVTNMRNFAKEGSQMVAADLGSRYDAKDFMLLGESLEFIERGMRTLNAALRSNDLRDKG